ncbi:HNH endonuclease family protein [Halodesulfovibrio marinisediminis]|uniref:TIGR02646 family protein n=1 Tax=Halodesulfovibrio marinisediminis DSM 17456 TaxID=1121457 RepID=A0A1N6I1M7_9BACT|nr:hypothetical protein [Halodesulfovibrio marinisediminis]SIO25921.1 hypothetical protein SAMN02745161_2344 [Halodesulfovibrio marinisediminis DSM 17456]
MIPVDRAPEPADFNKKVRKPGRQFLKRHHVKQGDPPPANFPWRRFWSRAIPMLHESYNDICAYLAMYLDPAVDLSGNREGSVEHFIPKAQDAWMAYEWNNYLLADRRVNSTRGQEELICPYDLDFYPFELMLDTGMIAVSEDLTPEQEEHAYQILDALSLDKEVYDIERAEYFARYRDRTREDALTNAQIARFAPFIWYEIQRQGYVIDES